MTTGSRLKRGALVATIVFAAAAPGVALAANPLKKSIYIGSVKLKVSSTGKSLALTSDGYCHNTTWRIPRIGIKRGKFSFSGSTTSHAHAVVNGSFVTSRKARGTVKIGSCAKKSFTARYSGGY